MCPPLIAKFLDCMFTQRNRLLSIALLQVVVLSCVQPPEVPEKPFDPEVIHLPEIIEPGPNVIHLTAGPNIEFDAQNAVFSAAPGTTIVFPPGVHKFSDEFIVNTSHITLAGAGLHATTLDFSQQETGAQGILGLSDHFTVQDLAVVNPAGDGIRIEGIDGATIRRVRVVWTNHSDVNSGAYGLYPVMCDNVLIEDSIVEGASDAGVYVGQSINIIVRRNTVERNVAGIEIENSQDADVYDNWTAYNTAGILVFDLPNLVRQGGQRTHVFDNVVFNNQTKSFAPTGSIVSMVPAGMGILIMANDNVEVNNNLVRQHGTASIAIVSYLITSRDITDPNYDPIPEAINIHDNTLERKNGFYHDGSELSLALNVLYKFNKKADIIYDGIGEAMASGGSLPEGSKLCIENNTTANGSLATFGNINLQNLSSNGVPQGPIEGSLAPHNCSYPPLATITLPTPPAPPIGNGSTTAHCNDLVTDVNYAAAGSDCPDLADYNLFVDATNPLGQTNGGGLPYDLTTPLFSDYAHKLRHVFIPPGEQIEYSEGDMVYPEGTVISKTFYYVDDETNPQSVNLMETRLLINRGSNGWMRLPYIWNNGVATLALGGGSKQVSWVDTQGVTRALTYTIPNINQCSSCHGPNNTDKPLGPIVQRLNMPYSYGTVVENQISHWAAASILSGAPANPSTAPRHPVWNDPNDGSLEERALAYLDSNCAHCHNNSNGRASSTGLWLTADLPVGTSTGICKTPIAAGPATGGLTSDIVPGSPEESIMIYRMNSVAAEIKMPELAKALVHTEGVQLVSDWIASLSGTCN